MKTIFLNIFQGCNDKIRFTKLIEFVNSEQVDILGLTELNGWDDNNYSTLHDFLTGTKYTNYIFCKSKSTYNLALFSKYPIVNRQILQDGFRTGAIIADIKISSSVYSVGLTHLHYKNETYRLRELRLLLNSMKQANKSILMGDFNAISPEDQLLFPDLLENLKKADITKFGVNTLHTDVIKELLKHNYIDVVKYYSGNNKVYTVPTSMNTDIDHQIPLRLDYIFVSNDLKSNLVKGEVINNTVTNKISDHFPVICNQNI